MIFELCSLSNALHAFFAYSAEAIRLNFLESDLFMWSDIGCFRNGPGEARYGSTTLILHRDKVPPHEMLYMAHQHPNPPKEELFDDKLGKPMHFYHSGTQVSMFF